MARIPFHPALVSLLVPLLALLATPSCTAPPAKLDQALEVLAIQQQAWNAGDLEAFLASGYLPTEELSFFSSSPPVRGFDQVLARYRKRYQSAGAAMGQLRFDQLEADALGSDHALVLGHWQLDFDDGTSSDGWFSLVMVRTDAGWRIRHDHTSSSRGD